MPNRKILLGLVNRFFEYDILDAAHSLETLDPQEAAWVIKSLPKAAVIQVFQFMEARHAARVLEELPEELIGDLAEGLPVRRTGEIFLSLRDEAREKFLARLSAATMKKVQDFITYPENSAGRIMDPHFVAFYGNLKVKDVIQRLRTLHKKAPVNYVYVVNESHQLTGVLNMRDLLLSDPDVQVEKIMLRQVFCVNASMDREEVALVAAKKRYQAIPVVDLDDRILGIIKTDELIEYTQEEATEDIQKMFGAGGDEHALSPPGFAIRKRLPWLYVNLGTAFLAAYVVSLFESVIAKISLLAVFLPVVAGQGGNAGAQTLAIVIRGLALKEILPARARVILLKEFTVALVNGVSIALVTGLIAWLWNRNIALGLVIGAAMIVNMVAAGLAGALVPLLMKAAGWDPAQSSSIILTTITDVVGFASFLGFAMIFQNLLLS